jgi:hypothetical protein
MDPADAFLATIGTEKIHLAPLPQLLVAFSSMSLMAPR